MLIKIAIRIDGVTPLLMHKPNLETQVQGVVPSAEEETEAAIYYDEDGVTVVMPSANMRACMHDGAVYRKFGKITARRALALLTISPPLNIPLIYDKENDPVIFTTTAVIQSKRILRSRPKFREWALEFELGFDDTEFKIPLEKVMLGWHGVLEHAGIYCGIGDNRPSSPKKPGQHGRFSITKYEQID